MANLLWVKMPSLWISQGILSKDFSSPRSISSDIAALKIYMYLCLFAEPILRVKRQPAFLSSSKTNLSNATTTLTKAESKVTYDELTEGCSLSRKLISAGLKRLQNTGLIEKQGTTRKVTYVVSGSIDAGWAKLPKRELVKKERQVAAFYPMKNRYEYERDALKLFLYLLSIRSNNLQYVDVSRGKISKMTGIDVLHIPSALGFMEGAGLLSQIEDLGFKNNSDRRFEENRLHRYWVIGAYGLVRYKELV